MLEGVGGTGGLAQLDLIDADTGAMPRLAMLAMRGPVTAEKSLIVGFNLTGTVARQYLIRVLGESLGVNDLYDNGVLIDPVIELYQGATSIAYNDDSGPNSVADAATASVGAQPRFNRYNNSGNYNLDSTLFLTLSPGSYTAEIRPYYPPTQSGEALFEIFAADTLHPSVIAPALTYVSKHQQAINGGDASFAVVAISKPAATYQWRRYINGTPTNIDGATYSNLHLTGLQPSDSGAIFDVVVSNGTTSVTSPARTLTILPDFHSADFNHDHQIGLVEITRVIQLYNYTANSIRTGEYHTDPANTEDGYAPGPGNIVNHHSADSDRDGKISATELSRVVSLFLYVEDSVQTGAYRPKVGTEDGFAPGSNEQYEDDAAPPRRIQ